MNARLDNPLTEANPLLRGMLISTLAIAAIGMLLLLGPVSKVIATR